MSARALPPQVDMSHGPGLALDEDLGPCFEEVEEKKGETLGGRPGATRRRFENSGASFTTDMQCGRMRTAAAGYSGVVLTAC